MRKTLLFLFSIALVGCGSKTVSVPPPDPLPSIMTQPANQSVQVGQTAIFTVVATGTASLAYQWRENNADISGAMSAHYTTPPTKATDSGEIFQVVVTNSVGTATSTSATLTVTSAPPPPVTVSSIAVTPPNANIILNQTQQFVGVVTYSDGSTDQQVTWSALGVGTINSAGLFTPNALGAASVIGAATADPTVLMTVPVQVSSLVSGKYAGLMTPSAANASQGAYYWDFNLDQNGSGALTSESGVNIVSTTVPLLTSSNLSYFDASMVGNQNGTAILMTATGIKAYASTIVSLAGTEDFEGNISGTFTNASGELAAQAGTFTFTQFGLLQGTWSGTVNTGLPYPNSSLTVSLVLNEVAPTSSTPRQLSGFIDTVNVLGNGSPAPFDSDGAIVQGDLFQITGDAAAPTSCFIIGQMQDPAGNSLEIQIGSPDFNFPGCILPPSQELTMELYKQ